MAFQQTHKWNIQSNFPQIKPFPDKTKPEMELLKLIIACITDSKGSNEDMALQYITCRRETKMDLLL
jgi:hypothetical protein